VKSRKAPMMAVSPNDMVAAILSAAQLTVSEREFDTMVRDYPVMRAAADSLYLPELEFVEPAVTFDSRTAFLPV